MLKRIQKDKLKKYRIVALFVALYFLFTYFSFTPIKFAFANDNLGPYYEQSNVDDDIHSIVENGTLDDIDKSKVNLVGFLEYGYNREDFDKQNKNKYYSLFLYVYIPNELIIEENSQQVAITLDYKNSGNTVSIAFTDNAKKIFNDSIAGDEKPVCFNECPIKYLSSSSNGLIHKYKINFENAKNFIDLEKEYASRVYCLGDLEIFPKNSSLAKNFIINKYYDVITNEENNVLVNPVDLKGVDVVTHHTFYRTGYSEMDISENSGWQNQISSCYFSLPKVYSTSDKIVSSMTCEFVNKFSTPMLIVGSQNAYNKFKEYFFRDSANDGDSGYPFFHNDNYIERQDNQTGNKFDIFFNPPYRAKGLGVELIGDISDGCAIAGIENFYLPCNNSSLNEFRFLDWIFLDENATAEEFKSPDYYFSGENIREYIKPFLIGGYFDANGTFKDDITYKDDILEQIYQDEIDGVKAYRYNPVFDKDYNVYQGGDKTYTINGLPFSSNLFYGYYSKNGYPYDKDKTRLRNFLFEHEFTLGSDYYEESFNALSSLKLRSFDYNTRVTQTYSIGEKQSLNTISEFCVNQQTNQKWWQGMLNIKNGEDITLKPFTMIDSSDIAKYKSGSSYSSVIEELSNKYYVDKNEIPKLFEYASAELSKGKDTWLLRYDVCEYYGYPVTMHLDKDTCETGFVSRQAVYLDFDYLQFTYNQGGQTFTVLANNTPVNVFNSITGAPKVLSWWEELLKKILLILFFLAVAVFVLLCGPILMPILSLSLKGAGLIIKCAFKIVFLPAKIIFRKRPKNDDDS